MKIEAQELRIGNLVNVDSFTQNFTITQIKEKTIRASYIRTDINQEHNSIIEIYRIEPIPLTEEWLLNLGLTDLKRKNEKHFKFNDFVYVLDYGCVTFNGVIISRQDIKYVHQLQNLYFALTGKEIVVKE